IAVPRIFTLSNTVKYNIEGYNKAVFENKVIVKSSSLERYPGRRFSLISQVIDKSTGQIITESTPSGFSIEDFKSIEVINNFSFDSPKLWSFETPHLYVIKTIISDSSGIIDEELTEIGIRRIQVKSNTI